MEENARIPVTLPRSDPTVSYWQDPPDPIADFRSTPDLPSHANIVIIGSGMTGAAVAWNLLGESACSSSLGRDVVMLEARQICSGATGRNGGHTKAASYRSFVDNAAQFGTETAVNIARLELANINAVHAFATQHSIDCDSLPCETVDPIYDPVQWEDAHIAVEAMRAAMPGDKASEYAFLGADELREKYFCNGGGKGEGPLGGVRYAAGSISAYRFGIGVIKMCLERGLKLYANTPATELKPRLKDGAEPLWEVTTPQGTILAKRVVLATNGYTAALAKQFQGVILPLRGQITAHRPGRSMPADGLPGTYSFIYEGGYEYMVPRPKGSRFAGDIVIGGGRARAEKNGRDEFGTTDDTTLNATISAYLRETTPKYFGDNWGEDDPDGRIRKEWTGIMGYSMDEQPLVGPVPTEDGSTGLWASVSFQGHGMVLCWMCARALVEMMEGRDGEGSELVGWFPSAFRLTEKRLRSSGDLAAGCR